MPVAMVQVGSIIVTVGVAALAGIAFTTTFNAGLEHPVELLVIVILYAVAGFKLVKIPVLFVLE